MSAVNDTATEAILRFLVGDFAFTMLPIVVIGLIRYSVGLDIESLLLLPEWAFASVVFFGLIIAKTIELKAKIQRDIFSFRLDFLIRTFTLLLIASVVCLSLSVLNGNGVPINQNFLVAFQFINFALAIFFLFVVHFVKILHEKEESYLPENIHPLRYLKRLTNSLSQVKQDLAYASFLLASQKYVDFEKLSDSDFTKSKVMSELAEWSVAHQIDDISKLVKDINDQLVGLKGHNPSVST